MKTISYLKSRAVVLYIIGLGLILSSLLFINHTAIKATALTPRDTVVVFPLRNDTAFLFDPARVTDWANSYDGLVLTEHLGTRMLETETSTGFAQVSSVRWDYFRLMHLPVVSGKLPHAGDGQTVLLCENMAFSLFGATDVINFTVKISDVYYRITGVVEALTDTTDAVSGFAWIGQDDVNAAGVLYLSPLNYNLLTARLDTVRLLSYLGHRSGDFTITDGNEYSRSIALRGQLLLALCFPGYIIIITQWLYRLFRTAKSKTAYVITALYTAVTLTVTVFFIRYIATIDLWLPAYSGEGFSGYSQLIFNTGLLAPKVYLPPILSALSELNLKANVAFGFGCFGIVLAGVTRLLSGSISKRSE